MSEISVNQLERHTRAAVVCECLGLRLRDRRRRLRAVLEESHKPAVGIELIGSMQVQVPHARL